MYRPNLEREKFSYYFRKYRKKVHKELGKDAWYNLLFIAYVHRNSEEVVRFFDTFLIDPEPREIFYVTQGIRKGELFLVFALNSLNNPLCPESLKNKLLKAIPPNHRVYPGGEVWVPKGEENG